jgi:hypothetical protein
MDDLHDHRGDDRDVRRVTFPVYLFSILKVMKKFITLSVIFALVTAIFIISFIGGVYLIQSRVSFRLPEGKHILVLGDSHTEHTVDDRIFSRAENISQGADAYLYSYCKLKKFLKENGQVDTVLLSFWGRSVLADLNEWLFSESVMIEKAPLYIPFMEKEDIAVFNGERASFINVALHPVYKFLFNMLRGKPLSYKSLALGGYEELHRDKLQEDIERRDKNKDTGLDTDSISVYQKAYLLKIAELCKSKDVELILMNVPTYKPEKYGDNEFANDFHGAYMSDVKYMDYSAFPLPDSCYGDIGHLNYRGARIFSQYLQERFSADVKEIGAENRWVYDGEPDE